MTDDLVYRIFVELAVLEGKRDVTGKWLVAESSEIPKLLKRANAFVERAAGDKKPRKKGGAGDKSKA